MAVNIVFGRRPIIMFFQHLVEEEGGNFLEAGEDVAVSIDGGADITMTEVFSNDFGMDVGF